MQEMEVEELVYTRGSNRLMLVNKWKIGFEHKTGDCGKDLVVRTMKRR